MNKVYNDPKMKVFQDQRAIVEKEMRLSIEEVLNTDMYAHHEMIVKEAWKRTNEILKVKE